MIKRSILLAMLVLLIAAAAFAVGPTLMSYQGQVLTAGGAPVANGVYPAVFSFYPTPVGGILLWTESGSIATTAGLFTHNLGSITSIPAGLFSTNSDVWLEVSVNGQIQTPRTQITSAGYSLSVRTVEGASGGTIIGNVVVTNVLTLGTPLSTNGALALNSASTLATTAQLYDYFGSGGALELSEETGTFYGGFEPDGAGTGGFLYTNNGNFGPAFMVDGNYSGGWPRISMSGVSGVSFDLSTSGNFSVNLPNDAVSALEILDEPGVASSSSFSSLALTGTMADLTTVTITIPAPGYIWLTGKIMELDLLSPGATNYVWAQIDESAGGSFIVPHASLYGGVPLAGTGPQFSSMHCQRMYFMGSAGSYTFRLEAMVVAGSASAFDPTLTAMYFPTSYGFVATLVSSAEAGEFESAQLVSATGPAPASGAVATEMYSVDFRELELKVAKTEADAQKARAALAEARMKEQLNSRPAPADEKK